MSTRQKTIALFIFAFLVAAFLRLPTLSNSFCDPDQGESAYAAMTYLDGRCPYSDAVIPEPPGTILLYSAMFNFFSYNMTWVSLLALLFMFAALILFFFIGRNTAGPVAGFAACGLYAFYQADIFASGTCPNYEYWIVLPVVGALALILSGKRNRIHIAAAGALCLVAFSMKQTAAPFVIAIALSLFALEHDRQGTFKNTTKSLLWFSLGFFLALIPFVIFLQVRSCVPAALAELNPLRLLRYLQSYGGQSQQDFSLHQLGRFVSSNFFLLGFLIIGTPTALVTKWRNFSRVHIFVLFTFLVGALLSVRAGGRYFGHYFVTLLPFLCLVVGWSFANLFEHKSFFLRLLIFVGLFFGVTFDNRDEIKLAWMSAQSHLAGRNAVDESIFRKNWSYDLESGYRNELINHLEWDRVYKSVSEWIEQNSSPDDRILCLDYLPEVYFFSKRFAPTKHQENFEYITEMPLPEYGLWYTQINDEVKANRKKLLKDLEQRPPKYILRFSDACGLGDGNAVVDIDNPSKTFGVTMTYCPPQMILFDELRKFLSENYHRPDAPYSNAVEVWELNDN